MLLPGTTYRIIYDIEEWSELGIKGSEFMISIDADPQADKIHINTSNNHFYLNRNILETHCELITDFNKAIYFYTPSDEYGMFSNFSDHGITMHSMFYPTVEHYYQASKFEDLIYKEKIRTCVSPKRASELGKSKNHELKTNWDAIKLNVMTNALRCKFEQHKDLKTTLLNTNDRLLIEHSPYDNFWGIGRTGIGLNYLGTLLMRTRAALRDNK